MKKFIILIPVYNDWESLKKLLINININIKDIKNIVLDCIIVNDASSIESPKLIVPTHISSIKIINMKENRGHARCNAFGIKYLSKQLDYDYLVLMDGDGEDRPEEIKNLVSQITKNPENSVVAKRIKRSEGSLFQLLYRIHKYLTLFSTGKLINFGNYSCLTKKDTIILSSKASLWSSFSGSVKKYIIKYNEINSIRGLRYFGPSQMSLYKLCIHSFSIIAVFKNQVFLRSLILLVLTYYLSPVVQFNFTFFQILLILFNLIIFIISFRENKEELQRSENNVNSVETYTH
tara:strand:- start:635 stop:1507 length:873 start_codon:yes stop_codon:yes gene_type:complete